VRRLDALEAVVGAGLGFVLSVAATFWVLPFWGLHPSLPDSIGITALFFGLSVARVYLLRRLFRRLAWAGGGARG
jgi:hypothetical protein